MRDIVKFNGEDFDIDSGLTAEEVKESMSQFFPSAIEASVERLESNGSVTWILREKPGEKG